MGAVTGFRFLAGKTWNREKNYEGNEHEGGPQFARIASSFDRNHQKRLFSERSHPPSPSFCASRRNESGCTFYVWPPRYAPEFRGSRVRRDKFYLTLPLLTSVPELKGDERWMARKLGRRKNDKEEKNGGEREDRPPCSLHRFRF